MKNPKRHSRLKIVVSVALLTGASLAAGGAVIAQPWDASAVQVSAQQLGIKPSQKPVALKLKDAKVSGLGEHKETPLAESASRGKPKARDPKTLPGKRPAIDPAKELEKLSTSLGGCLREYGSAGQCLPTIPPSQAAHVKEMIDAGLNPHSMPHTWTCLEVRQYFPEGIEIRQKKTDPQRLDGDRDGIGCSVHD
ncbi:hypothetical protein [Cryobacterium sp. Y11]|uniref:hypothetical protein n=1 Tax=Cryobacterium sp. Y11 TaxID=2045016 RepID=UPI000CE37B26|nr:hypothetical protein [Cryobacterium sp. Y11]